MPPKKNERGEASGGGGRAPVVGGHIERPGGGLPAERVPGGGIVREQQVQLDGDATKFEPMPEKLKGLKDGYYHCFIRVPNMSKEMDKEEMCFVYERWATRYEEAIDTIQSNVAIPHDGHLLIMRDSGDAINMVQVVLYDLSGSWIVLALKMDDLYLMGFRNQYGSFYFIDFAKPKEEDKTEWKPLGFKSDYGTLNTYSKQSVDKMSMGSERLGLVVKNLSVAKPLDKNKATDHMGTIALGLQACVVMLSEASRFKPVKNYFVEAGMECKTNIQLSTELVHYFTNWSKMSKYLLTALNNPEKIEAMNFFIKVELGKFKIDGRGVCTVDDLRSIIQVISIEDTYNCDAILEDAEAAFAEHQKKKEEELARAREQLG